MQDFQTCVRACVSDVSQQNSTLKCFIPVISPAVSMLFLVVSRFKNLVVTFFLLVCKRMLHLHGLTYDGMLLSFMQGNKYSISSKRSWNFHCLIFHFIQTTNLKRKELFFLWLIFSDEKSPSSKLWTVNADPLVRNWDVFLHSFASTSSPGWALNPDFTKHTGCFCRLFWRKTYILDCLVELIVYCISSCAAFS